MLEPLITLVALIWQTDSQMRERHVFGQSEMDKSSGRFTAWLCGGIIGLLALAGIVWGWLVW
ncbi:MAG: hypothetical protein ABIS50_08255 [Luteolibacter sp.]|uniref:hypothetical protein n=1 Tax=Luteolibacter sp. TaxID=1962973 RepID=UPI0032667564